MDCRIHPTAVVASPTSASSPLASLRATAVDRNTHEWRYLE